VRTLIVIPARYGSSRLPGKLLLRSTGKYLVQHVYERACQARNADQVVIATDDPRIVAAAQSFGAPVLMTRRDHESGTDRIAEVARRMDADVYVNVQGDEPQIDPNGLDSLIALLHRNPDAGMATLAAPLADLESYKNANCVKVVLDVTGRAVFFSRSPIPHCRDHRPDFGARPARFLQHLGTYAYRKAVLLRLAELPLAPLEELERLEQLRALVHGIAIQVGVVAQAGRGVDTFDDYRLFVRDYSAGKRRLLQAA
jgi:3-deoxy-manno-octulosonate cytidylyltransferase (CMP-KDO synthetase)